jgi:hypothetical protein
VEIPCVEAICRTPGFWGTHGCGASIRGIPCEGKRSAKNITQQVIDACGDCLDVCGEIIDDTALNSADSAIEAICVSPTGDSRLQLARQLTAMALNCCISGFGSDCDDPSLSELFNGCNMACIGSEDVDEITGCIDAVDCFNNGGEYNYETGFCKIGECSITHADCEDNGDCPVTQSCVPTDGNCHDRDLCNENLGLCFDPPGPAGSGKQCNDAIASACTVIPTGETGEHARDESKCTSGDKTGLDSCGACEHVVTVIGDPLVYGCSPCVAAICDEDPYCCVIEWDSICVGEVSTICD